MFIRPEQEEDFTQIHALLNSVFTTASEPRGNEQVFVETLRTGTAYIPELALVALEADIVVGYTVLSVARLFNSCSGTKALLLGPLAVAQQHQKQGIGSMLMQEGLSRARMLGYDVVFLMGSPEYYCRFGFRPVSEYGIRHVYSIPEGQVMVTELYPGALDGVSGVLCCV